MPTLSQISSNFFLNLINRLGVRPPPPEAFLLSNVVQPVSIVDTDVSIPAILTTLPLDSSFTAGELAAPVGGTILADTGALPVGTYNVLVLAGATIPANFNIDFRLQRRDAANAVSIWSQIFSYNVNGITNIAFAFSAKLLANERIRAISITNATAGSAYQASIFAQLVL